MTRKEIVAALRHLKVETGSIACLGCGREHNCGTRGCQIMRCAADLLENDENQALAMRRELELTRARMDCATACADRIHRQNQELRNAAALVTKLAGDAAVEREWIPVTERLPELWRNDETMELVNYMIYSPDFGVDIGNYHAKAKKWLCMALPCTVTHWMPLPEAPGEGE